jgi:hypothetical protein
MYVATLILLYIIYYNLQASGGASVTCNSEYINQLGLAGDVGDQEGGVGTVGMGTVGGRKKRDTVKRTLKKRQAAPAEQEVSQNVTVVSRVAKTKRVEGRTSRGSLTRDPTIKVYTVVGS